MCNPFIIISMFKTHKMSYILLTQIVNKAPENAMHICTKYRVYE